VSREVEVDDAEDIEYNSEGTYAENQLRRLQGVFGQIEKIEKTVEDMMPMMLRYFADNPHLKVRKELLEKLKDQTERVMRERASKDYEDERRKRQDLEAKNAKLRCMLEGAKDLSDDLVQTLAKRGIDVTEMEDLQDEPDLDSPQQLG